MKFSLNTSTVSALHLNQHVPVAREKLLKAFTQPALLEKWWLPEGAQQVKVKCDARPEGTFLLEYQTPSGAPVTQEGEWRATSSDMLVLNLGPDSLHKKEGGTLVTIELRKADGGTLVDITHEGIADGLTQERYRKEWLGRLARVQQAAG